MPVLPGDTRLARARLRETAFHPHAAHIKHRVRTTAASGMVTDSWPRVDHTYACLARVTEPAVTLVEGREELRRNWTVIFAHDADVHIGDRMQILGSTMQVMQFGDPGIYAVRVLVLAQEVP
jgi:hypothetical protein